MNSKKKNLLIAACVLFFLSVVYYVFDLISTISYVNSQTEYALSTFFVVYSGIQIAGTLYCAVVTLMLALGKITKKQNGFLISVIVVSFLCAGLVAFILVICAYNTNSYYVANNKEELKKEEKKQEETLSQFETKKEKIEQLRHLKESGLITEEEFNEKLKELI